MSLSPTVALSKMGVSIWLDDLSRQRLTSGNLASLMASHQVVGVTTNPTIFAQALSDGESYRDQVATLASSGVSAEEAVFTITSDDVREACDLFRPVYDRTHGVDGRVSIEVSPLLAHDTEGTISQAQDLYNRVDRPNVLIKIPATRAGLPAITETLARGISVNVTLIFSLERYREVMAAFLAGIDQARTRGYDISQIHSVASFFVSRVDTAVDGLLEGIGGEEATALRSQSGIANARLAYQEWERFFASPAARVLVDQGMNIQRPLWASTGVKDPALPATLYVTELAAAHTVNTMPEKTLLATESEAQVSGDRVTGFYADAEGVFARLAELGISFDLVTEQLEKEGVEKFIASWHDLLGTVSDALAAAS